MYRNIGQIVCVVILTLCCWTFGLSQVTDEVFEKDIQIQGLMIQAHKSKISDDYEVAINQYKEVLEKDINNDVASFQLAKIYSDLKQYEESKNYFELALNNNPKNEWYYRAYAESLADQKKYVEAGDLILSYVDLSYENKLELYDAVSMYQKGMAYDKALSIYEKMEKALSFSKYILLKKYELYRLKADLANATKEIEKLVLRYPKKIQYLKILSKLYEDQQKYELARAINEKIIAIDPYDAATSIKLAQEYKSKGDSYEYLKSLKPLFASARASAEPKINEILPLLERSDITESAKWKELLVEMGGILIKAHPDDARVLALYADILNLTDQKENTIQAFEKTLEKDKGNVAVWEEYLWKLAENNRYDVLVNKVDEALDYFPNNATIYYLGALGNYGIAQLDESISLAKQAMRMGRNNKDIVLRSNSLLGRLYYDKNDYSKSDKYFEKALDQSSKDPLSLMYYSKSLASRGEKLEMALNLAKTLEKIDAQNPSFLSTVGYVQFQNGKQEKAFTYFDKSLEKGGNQRTDILTLYGDLKQQAGKTMEAISLWKSALELNPKDEGLLNRINGKIK